MPPISRTASSTYWTPPCNRQRRLSEIPSSSNRNYFGLSRSGERSFPRPGDDSSTTTSRHYVDPWDLENYAFMRRHCTTDAETEYVVTSTPALESSQSDFYYVPQPPHEEFVRRDDSIGLVNGVEEEDFYNERYEMYNNRYSPRHLYKQHFKPNSCLHPRTDGGDSYEDYDVYGEDSGAIYSDDSTGMYNPRLDCQLYSPSVMLRRAPSHQSEQSLVYVYETGSRKRKMALPKGNLGISSIPPLRRNSTNSHYIADNYRTRRMMYGRLSPETYSGEMTDINDIDASYMMASYDDLHHPYYDIYCSKPFHVMTPQRFGLSKYGHLKIDYSFSWNSLDRYIAMD